MIPLSERLALLMSFIPQNAAVCDVGTDHGYLPAALISSGRVRSVIATDIREKPLANAAKNLERMGVSGVELRRCDGLAAVCRDEADTVVIAGMGGEVIAGILERAPWVKDNAVTLILQAMTSCEALRDFLADEGFGIETEQTLSENGKVYSVIVARFDGIKRNIALEYRYVGGIKCNTKADRDYIIKQYRRVRSCAESLEGISGQEEKYLENKAAAEAMLRLMEDSDAI